MPSPKDPEKYKLWKERISQSWKNMDPEARELRQKRIAEKRALQTNQSMKGKHHTQETKNKLSKSTAEYYNSLSAEDQQKRWKTGQNAAQKAMQQKLLSMTEEERANFYQPWIEAGNKAYQEKMQSMTPDEKIAFFQKRLPKSFDTKPEIIFESLIQEKGLIENIDYKKQFPIGSIFVDFFLLKKNVVIEIHGCFWHQCQLCNFNKGHYGKTAKQIRSKDLQRRKFIESQGYMYRVIWEHQLKEI